MKSWVGLALALLTLLSNNAVLILAELVTTVTVSVNSNPFCTIVNGVGDFGTSDSGAGVSGYGSGYGGLNGTGSSTGSAANSSASVIPLNTTTGHYDALGYYPAPADGNLLGGPVSTSPLMTMELCETDCQGYPYLALENGDECNCGSTAPSGPPSSSPPSKMKRQVTTGGCTPCVGNISECCGAPGGYALVYHIIPDTDRSSIAAYSTTNSVRSAIEAPSTSSLPISSGTVVSYTSTGLDGSDTDGSTTSYIAVASSSTYTSNETIIVDTTASYAPFSTSSSTSTYVYSTTNSASSVIFSNSTTFVPSALVPSGYSSNSSPGSISDLTLTPIPGVDSTQEAGDTATANGGEPGNGNGGSATQPTDLVNSGATVIGSGTATTNGGASATNNVGPEPTVESPTPSCAKSANYVGNNTKYTDYFGYTYDIRCNLDLQSMSTDDNAHADSFEECLEYCSLLADCVAVTYQDPPSTPSNFSNCYPKWDFGGYIYNASSADGVYSGVNVNGASPGTLENQNLCTQDNQQGQSYDGTTYYDDFGTPWTIGCDNAIAIIASAALSTTITDTLASCVDYCSRYDSCDMVNWIGPHTNGTANDPNCFPASVNGTAGAAGSAPGSGYALLSTF